MLESPSTQPAQRATTFKLLARIILPSERSPITFVLAIIKLIAETEKLGDKVHHPHRMNKIGRAHV